MFLSYRQSVEWVGANEPVKVVALTCRGCDHRATFPAGAPQTEADRVFLGEKRYAAFGKLRGHACGGRLGPHSLERDDTPAGLTLLVRHTDGRDYRARLVGREVVGPGGPVAKPVPLEMVGVGRDRRPVSDKAELRTGAVVLVRADRPGADPAALVARLRKWGYRADFFPTKETA